MKVRPLVLLVLLAAFQVNVYSDGVQPKNQGMGRSWQGEFSFGFNKSSGNTEDSELSMRLYADRKMDYGEIAVKGGIYYSQADGRMDAQKYYSLASYAYRFREGKWYSIYRIEGDHDRFASIDYRVTPSVGIGYWFIDQPDRRGMVESGIGLEHTKFKDKDKVNKDNEVILTPRAFFEKQLFGGSRISQDIYLYPSLESMDDYRVRSETSVISPLSEKLSIRLSLIEEYDSNPAEDKKNNDIRFISSLVYSFER